VIEESRLKDYLADLADRLGIPPFDPDADLQGEMNRIRTEADMIAKQNARKDDLLAHREQTISDLQLKQQPTLGPKLKIKRFLADGHLDSSEIGYVSQLIEAAGAALDAHESHDILGTVVFEGEDGVTYVMTVEAVIGEINPDYLESVREEFEDVDTGGD
jgi:hypothetical protein